MPPPLNPYKKELKNNRDALLRKAKHWIRRDEMKFFGARYHTPEHCEDVAELAVKLTFHLWCKSDEKARKELFDGIQDIEEALFVAELSAIFHDSCHKQGTQITDLENIRHAVRDFVDFCNHDERWTNYVLPNHLRAKIVENIYRTEYPRNEKLKYVPHNGIQQALLDADLLAAMYYEDVESIYYGLRNELNTGRRMRGDHDLTGDNIIAMQEAFNPEFFIDISKTWFEFVKPMFIYRMKMLRDSELD